MNNSNFDEMLCQDIMIRLASITNSNDAINEVLKIVTELCDSDGGYIFEFDMENETFSQAYGYVSNQFKSRNLVFFENEPLSHIDWCDNIFIFNNPVVFDDIEDIKENEPSTYSLLKAQNVSSLMVVPLSVDGQVYGIMTSHNNKKIITDDILQTAKFLGMFVARSMRIINLEKDKQYAEIYDSLTSAYNRKTFDKDIKEKPLGPIGMVYGDISELMQINKTEGFNAGDKLIKNCCDAIMNIFRNARTYRVGSGEFITICKTYDKKTFYDKLNELKQYVMQSRQHMAIGSDYYEGNNAIELIKVFRNAEKILSEDKAIHYNEKEISSSKIRDRRNYSLTNSKFFDNKMFPDTSQLKHFISANYFDIDVFFESVAIGEHYPCFGDMQNNMFFASKPICKMLGLQNPIIHNFLKVWEQMIPYKEDLEMYRDDVIDIIKNKRKNHDLRYRVRDCNGREFWIHCCGIIKWDNDNQKPLFFSGGITKLTHSFSIDPVTDLPKEHLAINKIEEFKGKNSSNFNIIGFKLNKFEQINESRGRNIANNLLKDISTQIINEFPEEIKLYRMDGLRFMALVYPEYTNQVHQIAKEIQKIAQRMYKEYNIAVRFPCAVGIIDNLNQTGINNDIVSDITSLLEVAKSSPEQDVVYFTQLVQKHKDKNKMMMALGRDVADKFRNFRVVIQPVVSAKDHKIVSGELLLRWKYEEEDISPMVFIPILEQNGMIVPVGKWVFEQAVMHCKRINTHDPNFYLNFNVSYFQVLDGSFVAFMETTLKQWKLDANRLLLELTETHYNNHPVKLTEFIEACRSINMRIALDDFGVGYSSLDLLLENHSDIVKLDKSLVQRMTVSEQNNDFITSIVYACHKFDKIVCVEGVETEQELQMVTDAGCDVIQGYYFYKPLETVQVYRLFGNSRNKN